MANNKIESISTPYLDKEIEFLNDCVKKETASFYQRLKLAEYKRIKQHLENKE